MCVVSSGICWGLHRYFTAYCHGLASPLVLLHFPPSLESPLLGFCFPHPVSMPAVLLTGNCCLMSLLIRLPRYLGNLTLFSQPLPQEIQNDSSGGIFFSFKHFIRVQLIYNAVLVSRVQFSESVIYSCTLSLVQLFVTPWTVAHQTPLSMGFSRQEYWSGLPFLQPEDLPDPGIKPVSPALAGRFFTIEPPLKSLYISSLVLFCFRFFSLEQF